MGPPRPWPTKLLMQRKGHLLAARSAAGASVPHTRPRLASTASRRAPLARSGGLKRVRGPTGLRHGGVSFAGACGTH
jgi:hypothetical protein